MIYRRAALLLRPTEKTPPDIWAKKHRRYPASSGMPGPRDVGRTPYVIDWQRVIAAGGGRYRRAVLISFAQSGKTEAMLDILGARFDQKPVLSVYCAPSREFAVDLLEPRLTAMLNQVPSLSAKLSRGRLDKKLRKVISGTALRLIYAGSETPLKGESAGLALVDELEIYASNIDRAGDPLALIEARGDTFADFMCGVASTPSLGSVETEVDPVSGLIFWKPAPYDDIESPIWRLWQEGTRFHWTWVCLHCFERFVPRFETLKWQQSPEGEHKTTPADARRSAHVECPRCGGVHTYENLAELNASGRYMAPGQTISPDGEVEGDPPDSSTASYWASGLASPFKSWGERAENWLAAVRGNSHEKRQTSLNSQFGELFQLGGHDGAPEWAEVLTHRGLYGRGELVRTDGLIFLTVDVQRDKLFWLTRLWCRGSESYLINYGTLWGDTAEEKVWGDLHELMRTPIHGRGICFVLIDSGFRPGKPDQLPEHRIYQFCRRFPKGVMPTKGSSIPMRTPIVTGGTEMTSRSGAKKYGGLKLLRLDTDHFKCRVFEFVRKPDHEPGGWHLPNDVTEDYARQIVSEARVKLPSGRIKWVRRSAANHMFDLEAMQFAAAEMQNRYVGGAPPTEEGSTPMTV